MKPERRKRNTTTSFEKDIHIRVREEYIGKLNDLARKRKYTVSRLLREIIETYIDNIES